MTGLELLKELKSFKRVKSWDIADVLEITNSWLSYLTQGKKPISNKTKRALDNFEYIEEEKKGNFKVTFKIERIWKQKS